MVIIRGYLLYSEPSTQKYHRIIPNDLHSAYVYYILHTRISIKMYTCLLKRFMLIGERRHNIIIFSSPC